MKQKNFGLSEEDFNRMVLDLKNSDTRFFEQVFLSHFKDAMNYLKKNYGACHEDAYDATMDTLVAFRKRFVEGKLVYGNLRYLFTKMAGQIFLRVKKSHVSIEEDFSEGWFTDIPYSEEDLDIFKRIWDSLEDPCKELLQQHYYGNKKLMEIAAQQERSSAAVRKQKERCLKKIKNLLEPYL